MLDNPEDPLTQDILMKCLIRECGKERLEYKIVALEATSKVLQAMDLNYFKPLYEMLTPFIRKAFDDEIERKKREESEKNEDNEVESKQAKKSNEDEAEAETFSLDLQLASVECLGQAWPETPETQNEFIEELLNILDAMIKNTTRKLQVIIYFFNWDTVCMYVCMFKELFFSISNVWLCTFGYKKFLLLGAK